MATEETKQTENQAKKAEENKKALDAKKKKNEKDKEEELSEEDKKKKEELDLLAERAQDKDAGVQKLALQSLTTEIKTSTSSMTSVPKPLKFLRPHYEKLKEFFNASPDGENKRLLADVLSILAMTMGKPGERESLKYRFQGTSFDQIGTWGHEYVRHLSGEIGQEYDERMKEGSNTMKTTDDLMALVNEIVPFDMKHNAEHEACDLLMEVDQIHRIVDFVDSHNYSRVGLYLLSAAHYVTEPEDIQILKVVLEIYKKTKQWPDALRVALRISMNDTATAQEIFDACEDPIMKKQLAFMLGRQHLYLEGVSEEYNDLLFNSKLSEHYLALAQDLEITEAKTPEDVYKSSGDTRGFASANVDSARQNLASSFVNAFVNAGFGHDKLMTEDGNKWLYKNKEHGMMSAAASLGMILQWDVDGGLSQIDKYLYANEDYIKAGALLAVGVVNSGVKNDCDPALALLSEYITPSSSDASGTAVSATGSASHIRVGAILGLGLAYGGAARQDLADLLLPVLDDSKASMEVVATAGLALGMIFVGTGHPDITEAICSTFMERDDAALNVSHTRFLGLGLGLLYLGKQGLADVTLETLKALSHPMGKYAALTVETCAYVGTGNVLKVQKLLDLCGDHLSANAATPSSDDNKNTSSTASTGAANNNNASSSAASSSSATADAHQGVAALGIALIAMGEDIGAEMAIRAYDHLLQYCDPVVRRAVPLALGLLSVSNPRIPVMDTLSKLSHDGDEEVALGAILGLGLIGAGTNNSRIANLLRGLAQYYYKEPNQLFAVRIAQGLVFMGKGTLTLSPSHGDRMIWNPQALAGLLIVSHAALDWKGLLLARSHYLLYALAPAMHPRMLMTFDANLKPLPVPVRVGQAVDTIGQAGRPKTITGFQTHTTPVLLGYGERAELATEDYLPLTSVLEHFVILVPNPDAPPKDPNAKDTATTTTASKSKNI